MQNKIAVASGEKPLPIKAGKKAIESGVSCVIQLATAKKKEQSKYLITAL